MMWIGLLMVLLPLSDVLRRHRNGTHYRDAIRICKNLEAQGKRDRILEQLISSSREFYEPNFIHYTLPLIGAVIMMYAMGE